MERGEARGGEVRAVANVEISILFPAPAIVYTDRPVASAEFRIRVRRCVLVGDGSAILHVP